MVIKESIRAKFENQGNERAVLACILNNSDLLIDVAAKLEETDFISSHHRALYSVITSLAADGVTKFDLVTVVNAAIEKSVLELIGGEDYILALFSTNANRSNFELFVNKILDSSTKFRLYQETANIQDKILDNLGSSDETLTSAELLAQSETSILDVSMKAQRAEDAVNIGEGLVERVEELARNPVDVVGLTTGFKLLDEALNGLIPGTLTVVAARAKQGKSTFLMNIASHISYKKQLPILYIDTEMMTGAVQMRLLSHLSRVNERDILTGKFAENQINVEAIDRACRVINRGKFYHRYYPGFTIDGLKSLVRKYKVRENIGALFFDYIKLPEATNLNAAKEYQVLGYLTSALKDLAGQLEIPAITAAQIKREDTGKSKYNDGSVADSDRILRYCDTLLAIARKTTEEMEKDGRDCGTHRVQVLAARGGGASYHGIDLACNFPKLTFTQALLQSRGVMNFSENGPSEF